MQILHFFHYANMASGHMSEHTLFGSFGNHDDDVVLLHALQEQLSFLHIPQPFSSYELLVAIYFCICVDGVSTQQQLFHLFFFMTKVPFFHFFFWKVDTKFAIQTSGINRVL